MKKIIKYLALVPLLAIMLFNCVIYGQIIAVDEDNTFISSMPDNYVDPHTDLQSILDICDFTDYLNVDFRDSIYEDYLYIAKCSRSSFDNFINGLSEELSISFYLFDFSDVSITSYDGFFLFRTFNQSRTYKYNRSKNTFSVSATSYSSKQNCYFNDDFSNFSCISTNTIDKAIDNSNTIILAIQSNVVEFNSSNLDVFVSFSPELTGAFSRTRYENGSKITLDNFKFTVTNNSKFSIQYLMAIYRNDEYFSPFNDDALTAQSSTKFNGKTYTGSPSYVYVKDEWIYLPHGTRGVITANAPSSWHYLSSGSSDSVSVGFEQVKLDINVDYTVVVYAVRNDANYATVFSNYNTFQYPACSDCCIEISEITRVYSSSFNILNPATFNPNSNENSYAFDVDDSLLFNRANGYIDENGEVIVDRVDTNSFANAGKDPNDPWNGYNPDHNAWEVYYKNQNTVSSDIDQLSNNFSSFFQFLNKIFSFFPKNFQNVILLGLTSIVCVAVLKVVF